METGGIRESVGWLAGNWVSGYGLACEKTPSVFRQLVPSDHHTETHPLILTTPPPHTHMTFLTCEVLSRSRTVTSAFSSAWKSTVTANGTPISSVREYLVLCGGVEQRASWRASGCEWGEVWGSRAGGGRWGQVQGENRGSRAREGCKGRW